MAINKAKKKEILEKVTDVAAKAKTVVFVNFKGLTVGDVTDIRKQLKGQGIGYTVAKKTLTKKAFAEKGFKGEMPELPGELALAYSEDLTAPAREIFSFEKKFDGKVAIVGGVFDGQYKSKDEMVVIATIPSREVLYGMFVNLINSPIQRLAIVMNEIAKTKSA